MDTRNIDNATVFFTETLPRNGFSNQNNTPSENNPTFVSHEAKVETNVSTQVTQESNNSLSNACELLENRQVENTTEQIQSIQTTKRMGQLITIFISTTISYIVLSVTISPLFIIGIAVSVLLLIISKVRAIQAETNSNYIGLQNLSKDMLLSAIKNNMTIDDISPEDYTKLLALLNNAVNSTPYKHSMKLLSNMNNYNKFKNNEMMSSIETSEELLKAHFKLFIIHLLANTNLIEHLHKLNLNVTNLQESMNNYIYSIAIDDISKTIEGIRYNPLT